MAEETLTFHSDFLGTNDYYKPFDEDMDSSKKIEQIKVDIDNGGKKDDFTGDDDSVFFFPNIPNDENDDFSWLFKVLPPEPQELDQEVPSGESVLTEQNSNLDQTHASVLQEPASMLVDYVFSQMDVTSLISHDYDETTFYKDEDHNIGPKEQLENHQRQQRKGSRAKRINRFHTNILSTAIGDTPVSLRRTGRKRSYQQMIKTEVSIVNDIESDLNVHANNAGTQNKRRRVQQNRRSESKSNKDVTLQLSGIGVEEDTITRTVAQTNAVVKNELNIILRKYKPVNPVDRRFVSIMTYRRGLIDPTKCVAGEQYIRSAITPQWVPFMNNDFPAIFVHDNSPNPRKIKDMLRIEWIENHNTIANAKAHGRAALGGKTLTTNGKFVSGTFITIDFDKEYENLLRSQNSLQSVIDWKRNHQKQSDCELGSFSGNNLDFKVSFGPAEENCYKHSSDDRGKQDKLRGVTGVVEVHDDAVSRGGFYVDKWTVFRFKGRFCRPNQPVVILQKIPDHIIEEMKAKPKKVTLESPYYNALTSYFDKRSTRGANEIV